MGQCYAQIQIDRVEPDSWNVARGDARLSLARAFRANHSD